MKVQLLLDVEFDETTDSFSVIDQLHLIQAAVKAINDRLAPEEPKVNIGGFSGTIPSDPNTNATL